MNSNYNNETDKLQKIKDELVGFNLIPRNISFLKKEGLFSNYSFIRKVYYRNIINNLSDTAIVSFIGHECSHLKKPFYYDFVYVILVSLIFGIFSMVFLMLGINQIVTFLISMFLSFKVMSWIHFHNREFQCDIDSVKILKKYGKITKKQVSSESFRELFDAVQNVSTNKYIKILIEIIFNKVLGMHPPIKDRIEKINKEFEND